MGFSELFESELTAAIKKSEKRDKEKDKERSSEDDNKIEKDKEAAEKEADDKEPNTPKKNVKPEDMMGQDEPAPEPEPEPATDVQDAEEEKKDKEKKKLKEDFFNAMSLKESTVNLDDGDDPSDIEEGDTVIVNGTKYKCISTMGDNGSFKLKGKKGTYIYRSSDDSLEKY